MAISVEWIINKAKKRIYAISHAKAVVRGTSTVDADLALLENNISSFQESIDKLQADVDSLNLEEITGHLTKQINSEEGAHNIRYLNDELQFYNGETWITIETGAAGIPPMDMKLVSVSLGADNTKLIIKGIDPDDTLDGNGSVLCKWMGTKVVRKVGSYPTKPTDGVLVVDYQTRNQYKSTGFVDTGLVEGETYYYRWFPYSDQGSVNKSDNSKVNRAFGSPKTMKVLGVTADWANNTFTRTDDAVNLTAGASFDQFKMFGQRRRCIVADDRKILAFYGDEAYTETGKLTKQVIKDEVTYPIGTSVQVMVYQPKFYYKVTPITKVANPYGTGYMIRKATYQIAETQYEGFKLHPNFIRNGKEVQYILQSAFEACTQSNAGSYVTNNGSISDKLASIAGAKPVTGSNGTFTRNVARTKAAARGTGWQIGDVLTAACSQLLFMIEYATMNTQTAIGQGNVNGSGNYSSVIVTGGTSSLGNASGRDTSKTDGLGCVTYRGEENLWGNVWTWQDGGNAYNSSTGILYWADSEFADDKTSSPYKSTGFNFARGNGYISAYGYSDECDFMFIPCEISGDSANPVGDYFYQAYSSSSMTVAALGGRCDGGSRAGLFFWSVDGVSSASGWAVGSRLACVPLETSAEELSA